MTLVETDLSVVLDGESLDIEELRRLAEAGAQVSVSQAALDKAGRVREQFEGIVAQDIPIYGVTTGYGEMIYMLVDPSNEVELQTNLVRSHSAGVGPLFNEIESRAILAARLNALAKGHSAVRPELLDRLALYLTLGIIPAIPEMGSLGASGDLAPLAHIACTVIGEGYVLRDGERVPTAEVLAEHGIEPMQLRFKEGLALINGTSAMTGLGSLVVSRALDQVRQAEIVTALVVEGLRGSLSPFMPEGHDIARPHQGQIDTAANLRALMAGTGLAVEHSDLRQQVADTKEDGKSVTRTDVYRNGSHPRAKPGATTAVPPASPRQPPCRTAFPPVR